MQKTPGENGSVRCQDYKENAIKKFMRGLDRATLALLKIKILPP